MRIHFLSGFMNRLKYLLRSRSFDFMVHSEKEPSRVCKVTFNGHPVYYRSATNDVKLLNWILFKKGKKSEYHLDIEKEPRVILDIGGNIGISAVYHAITYPHARIITCEPVPENFQLLEKNIEPYPNIRAFCIGLGADNGSFPIFADKESKNKGGYSLIQNGSLHESRSTATVLVKKVSDFLAENSVNSVDLIKIDTEGSEHPILTAFPQEILRKVGWIVGELHEVKDFELLAYLSQWFSVGINKSPGCPYSLFRAKNRVNT